MERIVDLYQQTRKLVHTVLLGLAPAGVLVEEIFVDGKLDPLGSDQALVLSLAGLVGGWVATYASRNKVGALSRSK